MEIVSSLYSSFCVYRYSYIRKKNCCLGFCLLSFVLTSLVEQKLTRFSLFNYSRCLLSKKGLFFINVKLFVLALFLLMPICMRDVLMGLRASSPFIDKFN